MTIRRVLSLGLAISAFAALPAFGLPIPYKFQEISYPGDTFTQLLGINSSGVIAGYHGEMVNQGFTLVLPSAFTTVNYPSSAQTQVIGINTAGDTAGFYLDAAGVVHGFTRIKGTFATADAPSTMFNQVLGLNNVGELAGYSSTDPTGATMQMAFVRQTNGAYMYLTMPAGTTNSQATGINDAHTVCGFYVDADDNNHGFLMMNGMLTTVDYPGAGFTQIFGINNSGQVVGIYQDAFGGMHGFVWANGSFQSVDEPMAAPGTTLVNGINDAGWIVGFFTDADGNTVGFAGTPQMAAETMIFRSVLTPPAGVQATGTVDVIAHLVHDGTGQIATGSLDFLARPNLPSAGMITGLSIQSGANSTASPAISSGLSAANTLPVKAGGDMVKIQAQVMGDVAATLTSLRGVYQNPNQYYVNLTTTAGTLIGQLQPAQWVVLMGLMSGANEVPPATNSTATGVAQAVAIGTTDANGKWTSGEVYLTATYANQMDPAVFTGFHIHLGPAGVAGPVVIPSGMPSGVITPNANGSGVVGPYQAEISLTNAQEVTAFTDLFTNPGATYMNIHNTTYPGGFMRAQLRSTDTLWFPLFLNSANEVAMPSVTATGPSSLTYYTIRNQDGSVAAATAFFDVNYRLPGAATIVGLHMHDAAAGINGPVTVPIVPTANDPTFTTSTGFGNFFDWTPPVISGIASVNDAAKNPENHYVNFHISTDPAGVMRAQLAPPVTAPIIQAAISADMDVMATTVAPGELISIFGANLAKTQTSLMSSWAGQIVPSSLNGASVTVGGYPAPLIYVAPGQINAQVPFEAVSGKQDIVVNNGVGPSDPMSITVAATAPAIFFDPMAAVIKNADYSLVTDANPAHAGDILLVYWTGGGQTNPALGTGGLVPSTAIAKTATVTSTIGGKSAAVVYSIASPGFLGLYQTAVTVPSGVTGSVPLILQMGSVNSNTVNITVQ